ncbi:MAG: DUF3367 domain-containing protein [Acidimicrobiales bacterium]|nr:DUF3367 domain-containing protein [Acidimicrobiales bacterium]
MTRERLWPTGVLLGLLALVATFTNEPTRYVGDNRFEQYWGPVGRLLRETSLWDGTRGLGRVGEEFWPSSYPVALLRGLGLSAPVSEHLWHAVVLVVAGLGMVALLRVLLGRIGPAAVVAGLLYAFNPFTATFLLPSVLFWNYAIAPWLLVVFLSGVTSPQPWRWAAGFALLAFSAGNADTPGTFFAVLWLAPAAVWLVTVDRSASWRQVAAWLARAAILSLLTCAAAVAKTLLGSDPLAQRLQFTELPERVNETSSWAESWRGLGFWLSYFSDASGASRLPGGAYYYETALGVLVTFVAPVAAAVVLWRSRWRARSLFGGLALLSLAWMVGSYPPEDPTPAGWLLLQAYDAVPGLASLRNTYKAGSGLLMGVSALVGVGVVLATRRLEARGPGWRAVPGVAAVAVVLAVSLPFWNGGLYPERTTFTDVPTYWEQALEHLDARPGSGRVLVLPGTTKTAYRWGEPGDDLFDTYLRRHPNVVSNAFPLSGPESADLVDALEARIAEGSLGTGELAPVLTALGVDRVVVRNDLDWEASEVARPADLDLVREDGALRLERTFGDPGESVTDPDDATFIAGRERSLPPVEVYEVVDAPSDGAPLARAQTAPLVISGDGHAWPLAARAGLLEAGRPVVYSGDLTAAELARALESGSPLVVTDTNRRRLTRIRGAVPTRSHTLSEGQDLDQPAQDLFGTPGSQSVAEFPDATAIDASSSGTRIIGFQPWLRPANAFDGNYTTSWLTGGLEDPIGSYLRVDFREPQTLDRVSLLPFLPSDAGRRVTAVSLHFSDGDPLSVRLDDGGTTDVRFPARTTESLEIRIEDVSRAGTAAVGFREVAIPGVDLSEVIALPDDVVRAAGDDAALRDALATVPVRYLFDRIEGVGAQDEELVLRRAFELVAPRTFTVAGELDLDIATTDLELDRFLSGFRDDGISAHGTTRAQGALENRGLHAIDGDADTAWAAPPREGEALTVGFPTQVVSRVEVTSPADASSTPVDEVTVLVGGREEPLELRAEPGCDPTERACDRSGTLEVPPTRADEVEIRLGGLDAAGAAAGRPARLGEVRISDADGPPVQAAATPGAGACTETALTVDGRPVGIRLAAGDLDRALAGEAVPFAGCEPVDLSAGRHRLTTADAIVDGLTLASGSLPAPRPASEPAVEVVERGAGHLRLRVEGEDPMVVSTGQSYDDGWRAVVDGEDLGPPRSVDTLSSWSLPAGTHLVDLTYAPERTYRGALAATVAGLVLCVALVLRPVLRGRTPPVATDRPS